MSRRRRLGRQPLLLSLGVGVGLARTPTLIVRPRMHVPPACCTLLGLVRDAPRRVPPHSARAARREGSQRRRRGKGERVKAPQRSGPLYCKHARTCSTPMEALAQISAYRCPARIGCQQRSSWRFARETKASQHIRVTIACTSLMHLAGGRASHLAKCLFRCHVAS